ncbi:MAG: penicillin-binding protein 2 [Oligoflexus sp.]|nr:penicillin-binding protein 2 [Oligoflexus sp.]
MNIQSLMKLWRQWTRPKQAVESFRSQRSKGLSIAFFVIFAIVAVRAITIQVLSPSADILENLARRQYQTKIELAPYRGNIYDRRGEPLAISIRRPSFYINPRVFDPTKEEIKKISKILNMPFNKVRDISDKKSYFAWLARKIERTQADQVNELKIQGIWEISEPSRFYPSGLEMAPILGTVGIDNNGMSGLELAYEKILKGDNLTTYRHRDARGKPIYSDSIAASPEKTGQNIVLTIDSAIQDISQTALEKGLIAAGAKSGFVIVSDPHTGRILAIANHSLRPHAGSTEDESQRNFGLNDTFEPGSVVKPLLIGKVLDAGMVKLEETFNTYNGFYHEGSIKIHDDHPLPSMNTEEVITHSSNIGTYQIVRRLGPERLYNSYMDLGFTKSENLLGISGQSRGRLSRWEKWAPSRFANLAFGQGIAVTAMEMVQAYGAIANGGTLMKPYLIDHIESAEGGMLEAGSSEILRRVYSPEAAFKIRGILQKTVDEGTGSAAKVEEYTTAGKTGTSQKFDITTHSYSPTLRVAGFIGFAPATDPHLVIYVVVDEPSVGKGYGGKWAAPIFKEVAEETLRYLNVAPDKVVPKDVLAKGTTNPVKKSAN